jgi:hypothetical protein
VLDPRLPLRTDAVFGPSEDRGPGKRQALLDEFLELDMRSDAGVVWLLEHTVRLDSTGSLAAVVPALRDDDPAAIPRGARVSAEKDAQPSRLLHGPLVARATTEIGASEHSWPWPGESESEQFRGVPGVAVGPLRSRDVSGRRRWNVALLARERRLDTDERSWVAEPVSQEVFVGLYEKWQTGFRGLVRLSRGRKQPAREEIERVGRLLTVGLSDVQLIPRLKKTAGPHDRPERWADRIPKANDTLYPIRRGWLIRTFIGELSLAMLERLERRAPVCPWCDDRRVRGRGATCGRAECRLRAKAENEAMRRRSRESTARERRLGSLRVQALRLRARLKDPSLDTQAAKALATELSAALREREELGGRPRLRRAPKANRIRQAP